MQITQRVGTVYQRHLPAEGGWYGLRHGVQVLLEYLVDKSVDDAGAYAFGGRIHRSQFRPGGVLGGIGTDSVFRVYQFQATRTLAGLSVTANPVILEVGTHTTGINNGGLICGRTDVDAVVWTSGTASLLDRPGKGKRRVPRAWAWDISESGLIVGEAGDNTNPRACYWDGINGSLTYLDESLEAGSPLQGLSSAEAVNGFGDIVGNGWIGSFIAIPPSQ